MKVTAIIPVRKGSKSIPNKGLVPIAGKPMIHYAVECCLESKLVDEVVVSTDYPPDAIITRDFGNRIRVVGRNKEAATDTATSEMALLDCLDRIELADGHLPDVICFVQCTSPLTEPKDLDRLIGMVTFGNKDSSAFYVNDYGHFFEHHNLIATPRQPRQKRTPLKREAGNAWCFRTDLFKKFKTRLFGDVGYVNIAEPKNLEIDEYHDITLAAALITEKRFRNKKGGIIYVDIDQTLFCSKIPTYEVTYVNQRMIDLVNYLYEHNFIILWTSRGTVTQIDWREHTEKQLANYGVKYHELRLKKPMYDFWVDDKAVVV
jgi:N-acylneuraminate cytidylyltransferase